MRPPSPPGIYRTLRGRFFISRLIMILVPLAFCLVFSVGLSFLMVDLYAKSAGRNLRWAEIFVGEIFRAHILLLGAAGIALICFLTGLMFLVHTLLTRKLIKTMLRPLDDLSLGMEKLRNNQKGFRLNCPENLFLPLYKAFNEAALGLEERQLKGGDPRSSLTLLRDGLEEFENALGVLPERQKKYMGTIGEKLRTLKDLLDQLILFLALDRGEFLMSPGALELGRFLEDLTRELSEKFRERGLFLGFEEYPEALTISADAPWLRDVLVRLLENCIKHKRLEWGTALVKYRRRKTGPGPEAPPDTPELAEIIVIDNSPRRSEDSLPDLFERAGFFCSGGGALPPGGGEDDGLALAISARIVKYLGGSIYAERPGRGGLSVIICFPILNRPEN